MQGTYCELTKAAKSYEIDRNSDPDNKQQVK